MITTRHRKGTFSKDIKLDVDPGKIYEVANQSKKQSYKFRGRAIYKTKDYVTFIDKNDIRESFLIKDFFIGEYKLREM